MLAGCGQNQPPDPEIDVMCPGSHCVRVEYQFQSYHIGFPEFRDFNWGVITHSSAIPEVIIQNFRQNDGVQLCEFEWDSRGSVDEYRDGIRESKFAELRERNVEVPGSFWVFACNWKIDESGHELYGFLGQSAAGPLGHHAPEAARYVFVFTYSILGYIEETAIETSVFPLSQHFDWVVTHELGHAVAGLRHPNEVTSGNPEPWLYHADPAEDLSYYWCVMWDVRYLPYACQPGVLEQPCVHRIVGGNVFCGYLYVLPEMQSTCRRYIQVACGEE